ncbi:MAG: glycosyltransferase [Nitrosomonas sp.]|nr:glycosyltransferase [Nitrosomonas sp.]
MTISKSKKDAENKNSNVVLGQPQPQSKKHLTVKNPPFLLHNKENQVVAGIKLEEAIFVDNKLLLRGWVLGFPDIHLLCDGAEVPSEFNRRPRKDVLEMYSVTSHFDVGFEFICKSMPSISCDLRWHLFINGRIVAVDFSLEVEKINPWKLYNQFVLHQMLHLEPFNLNSLIGEHAIAHLKGEKAEASYLLGQRVIAKQLTDRPLISILMPVYQVKPAFLKASIESVLAQTYDNWELCIVDDASIRYRREILAIFKKFSKIDKRISYSLRKKNGHICNATNDCLVIAKGEFIALLDHDDLLTPDALYEMTAAINANPDLDILYSDEDKVDECDVFFDPYYKPDWSPHTLWARMYVGHLTVYRKSLVKQVKGFRVGFEGSQDYDLLLRCSEKTNKIHHVPRVLYHWRSHSESTASESGGAAKNYCADAGRRAVEDAMKRRGLKVATGLISEHRTAIELYSNLVFRELKKAAYLVKFDVTRH